MNVHPLCYHIIRHQLFPAYNMSKLPSKLRVAFIIVSDTAFRDRSTDKVYDALSQVVQEHEQWEITKTEYVPDDTSDIKATIDQLITTDPSNNLILTSGGTGFSTKDNTPEAVESLLQKKASGLVYVQFTSNCDWQTLTFKARHASEELRGYSL